MHHKCFWAACQNSVHLMTSFFPNRHPINPVTFYLAFSTVIPLIVLPSTQRFQSSSKLNLSPFMSISRPSTHGHRTVSVYLFDCHPNWPPFADNDEPNGVNGATEQDKNKARRAWSNGPDGSKSMDQRKGKPIPCIGPLQIEHYTKKGSIKNRAQVLGDFGMGTLNQRVLHKGMTCPPRFGFLKQSPIRKELGLQGREANPHYYKSPNTLSHQDTHN